jgi:hypothetical protein
MANSSDLVTTWRHQLLALRVRFGFGRNMSISQSIREPVNGLRQRHFSIRQRPEVAGAEHFPRIAGPTP